MHLARTSAKNPKSLIVHSLNSEDDSPDYNEDLITLHDLKSPQNDVEFMGLPYLRNTRPEMAVTILIGSFNGIVCVMVKDDQPAGKHYFYLWNPATQQSKHVPGPTIEHDESIYYSVGFGFDSIADDYKVVRVLEFGGEGSIRAEVYSAVEDSWKEVKVELSFYVDFFNCDASVKGVLYWSAGEHLVTYDLNSELFNNKIVLPNVEKTGGSERCIVEFRDSVALCVYYYNGEFNNEISIWTLDDGIGKGSWSKKLSFESLPQMEGVFGYLMAGDNILGKKEKSLILHDPKSQQTKNLSMPNQVYTMEVLNYCESLVMLKGSTQVPRKAKKDTTINQERKKKGPLFY